MTGLVDYAGRRVVVTGCASGIGRRLVDVLLAAGAEVVGLDRTAVDIDGVDVRVLDLASSQSVREVAVGIEGPVDALFNVAGLSGTVPPETVIGVNFWGTRELTEALVDRLPEGGAVVTTGSIAGSRYRERRALVQELSTRPHREAAMAWCRAHREEVGTGYSLSKDAVIWYTLHRSVELAEHGIRMNCVAPGLTDTPILEASRASRGEAFLDAIPRPLGRSAGPEEQASVMAFLGSSAASYVAGQILWVDGGYSAGVETGRFDNVTGAVGKAPREDGAS